MPKYRSKKYGHLHDVDNDPWVTAFANLFVIGMFVVIPIVLIVSAMVGAE